MPTYYLIVGNSIIQEIIRTPGDVTALPLLDELRAVSLMNQKHVAALLAWIRSHGYPNATAASVIEALGLIDNRTV